MVVWLVGGFVVAVGVGIGAWYPNTHVSKDSALGSSAASGPMGSHSALSTTTSPPSTTTTTTTTDPGRLPQTAAFPSADTVQFRSEMQALFQGVVTDSMQTSLPAYFPESAYLQLKTIVNPKSDYVNRLLGYFDLDLGAAHALLGVDATTAQFVQVDVPSQYGHWIPPGICENRVGYFEVPNARIVYEEDNQVRSFGIASMISWRGVWYVAHFGAILRSEDRGAVDNPTDGPGTPEPSSTC